MAPAAEALEALDALEQGDGPVEAFARWVAEGMSTRDESHGMVHAERVRRFTLEIVHGMSGSVAGDQLGSLRRDRFCPMKVLELAALGHDVFDHKYCGPGERAAGAEEMRAQLRGAAGASEEEVEAVLLIIDNISFSKEKRGELDLAALRARGWGLLRDVVSDADKLDALGEDGLLRCFAHKRHCSPEAGEPEVEHDVREHCREKLLLLADQYIRTDAGRALARPRHEVIARFAA